MGRAAAKKGWATDHWTKQIQKRNEKEKVAA